MRLTPSIILPVSRKLSILLLLIGFMAAPARSQEDKETLLGASLALELEKDISTNLSAVFEEEVRLLTNGMGFDRTATSLGLDYSFLEKKAKIGGFYTFIYKYNNDQFFEPRHRFYLNLIYKENLDPFTIMWRGRAQATIRDESLGSFRINPKYILKNKIEVAYTIFGSPIKPFISCDFYTLLNNPEESFQLTRLRYAGGINWRLNRTNSLEIYLRYDQNPDSRDANTASLGAAYKVKL